MTPSFLQKLSSWFFREIECYEKEEELYFESRTEVRIIQITGSNIHYHGIFEHCVILQCIPDQQIVSLVEFILIHIAERAEVFPILKIFYSTTLLQTLRIELDLNPFWSPYHMNSI